MTDDQNLIPEAELAAAIAEASGQPCPRSYPMLANDRRSGAWPAVKVGSRWYVRQADLPLVLSALGLTIKNEKRSSIVVKRKSATPPAPPAKAPRRGRATPAQ